MCGLLFSFRRRKVRPEYDVTKNEATELIEDRIKFKLFYAEQHYNKLLQYQQGIFGFDRTAYGLEINNEGMGQ